jgi:hypothetical protein
VFKQVQDVQVHDVVVVEKADYKREDNCGE